MDSGTVNRTAEGVTQVKRATCLPWSPPTIGAQPPVGSGLLTAPFGLSRACGGLKLL